MSCIKQTIKLKLCTINIGCSQKWIHFYINLQICNKIAILQHGEVIINTTMPELLSTISKEKFTLYLNEPCLAPLSDYSMRVVDSTTLEMQLDKNESISDLVIEYLGS